MDNFPGGQRTTLSTAETGTPLASREHLRKQQQNRDTKSSHRTKAANRPLNRGTSRDRYSESLEALHVPSTARVVDPLFVLQSSNGDHFNQCVIVEGYDVGLPLVPIVDQPVSVLRVKQFGLAKATAEYILHGLSDKCVGC